MKVPADTLSVRLEIKCRFGIRHFMDLITMVQLVTKECTLCRILVVHHCVHKSQQMNPAHRWINRDYFLDCFCCKTLFNIILSLKLWSLKWSGFLSFLLHLFYLQSPNWLILPYLNYQNIIRSRVESLKFIMQFTPTYKHFLIKTQKS